jgi:hypothetical protein
VKKLLILFLLLTSYSSYSNSGQCVKGFDHKLDNVLLVDNDLLKPTEQCLSCKKYNFNTNGTLFSTRYPNINVKVENKFVYIFLIEVVIEFRKIKLKFK